MDSRSGDPTSHRILIVDDEAPARRLLADLITALAPASDLSEAVDGEEALSRARTSPIDIAFLDIDMPGSSGVVVAENLMRLPRPPVIVFATGSDRHAVRGFELQAIDYLLKPFSAVRVAEALRRARSALDGSAVRERRAEAVGRMVSAATRDTDKLWAERENGARVLVDFRDIGWAQARDKHVYVRTAGGELKVRLTLTALAARLPDRRFVRVHRTWLVNIDLVREVIPWDSHSMTLIMGDPDATEIPVGRNYTAQFRDIAGW